MTTTIFIYEEDLESFNMQDKPIKYSLTRLSKHQIQIQVKLNTYIRLKKENILIQQMII